MDQLGFGDEQEDFLDTNDSSDDTSGDESDGERALAEDMGTRGISQDLLTTEEFTWVPQADKEGRTYFLNTQNGATSWELPSARVYLDDWDDSRVLSDEEEEEEEELGGQTRSSLDSENSDVLMLGPIHPELAVPEFKEFNVLIPPSFVSDFSDFPFNPLHPNDPPTTPNPIQETPKNISP
jgi:hypothetical protein